MGDKKEDKADTMTNKKGNKKGNKKETEGSKADTVTLSRTRRTLFESIENSDSNLFEEKLPGRQMNRNAA